MSDNAIKKSVGHALLCPTYMNCSFSIDQEQVKYSPLRKTRQSSSKEDWCLRTMDLRNSSRHHASTSSILNKIKRIKGWPGGFMIRQDGRELHAKGTRKTNLVNHGNPLIR